MNDAGIHKFLSENGRLSDFLRYTRVRTHGPRGTSKKISSKNKVIEIQYILRWQTIFMDSEIVESKNSYGKIIVSSKFFESSQAQNGRRGVGLAFEKVCLKTYLMEINYKLMSWTRWMDSAN